MKKTFQNIPFSKASRIFEGLLTKTYASFFLLVMATEGSTCTLDLGSSYITAVYFEGSVFFSMQVSEQIIYKGYIDV